MKKKILFLLGLWIGSTALFYASFNNFFFSDDFFHIVLTWSQSILASFNILKPAAMGFYLYRPLGTQVFWGLGYPIFGLNPLGYHLIYHLFFLINIFLVFYFLKVNLKLEKAAYIGAFLYAFAASNFNRLFFLSTFQENIMCTFVLLTLILYSRHKLLAIITFILALTGKEIAVTTPIILAAYEFLLGHKKLKSLIPFFAITAVYFFAHKYFFGFFSASQYPDVRYVFAPLSVINNYLWYFFWSLGLPEHYVNLKIFTMPTIFNPKLFTDFGQTSPYIATIFISLFALVAVLSVWWLKHRFSFKLIIFGVVIFLGFLLPVGFFPFHKFASSLSTPLLGFCLILGILLAKTNKFVTAVFLTFYLALSIFSLGYNLSTHWNVKRAEISKQALTFFQQNFSNGVSSYDNVYFLGGENSKELSLSLSRPYALDVLYKKTDLKVYYEGDDHLVNLKPGSLIINAQQFTSN